AVNPLVHNLGVHVSGMRVISEVFRFEVGRKPTLRQRLSWDHPDVFSLQCLHQFRDLGGVSLVSYKHPEQSGFLFHPALNTRYQPFNKTIEVIDTRVARLDRTPDTNTK